MLRSQWGIVEDGMLQRVWGTNRDITDLNTIERELDASEQQMADLLETLHLLVVMLHEDGTIAFCNKHLHRLTGWSSAAVAGKNWFDLMVPPEDRAKAQAAFASAKLQCGCRHTLRKCAPGPKGRRWWIAWDTTSLRDSEGNIVISANVGRDISEYKMLEAQFRQAQELESIGQIGRRRGPRFQQPSGRDHGIQQRAARENGSVGSRIHRSCRNRQGRRERSGTHAPPADVQPAPDSAAGAARFDRADRR